MTAILPEIGKLKGVEQPSEFHPEGDVFVHTMLVMAGLKHAPVELAMACLLHDIAKPQTFERAPIASAFTVTINWGLRWRGKFASAWCSPINRSISF